MDAQTPPTAPDGTAYPVDAEHGQLRLVVAVLFLGVALVSFFVLLAIIPANTLNLLAVLGALVIAAVVTSIAERQLKARWPSGREIGLRAGALTLSRHGKAVETIAIDDDTQLLQWCFEINKRARVPRGWWMVAVAVRNTVTDATIAVYALLSPEDYEDLNAASRFIPLSKPAQDEAGTMRLAGQQKRLHAAEQVRWNHGVEMQPDHFQAFVAALEARFDA